MVEGESAHPIASFLECPPSKSIFFKSPATVTDFSVLYNSCFNDDIAYLTPTQLS